eukprot:15438348-Alexandrium_andersonii.AAC.1
MGLPPNPFAPPAFWDRQRSQIASGCGVRERKWSRIAWSGVAVRAAVSALTRATLGGLLNW